MKDDIVIRLRALRGKCQTAPAMAVWSRDLREAADEIERLRDEVREYHKIRADYCAAWSKWIDDHGGLDVAEWCRVYADAVPHPNPDGPEVVQLIHSRLDARFREAADELERLVAENARIRAERDEARRMWCEAEAVGNCLSVDDMKRRARAEAKRREWDCYKEDGK